MTAFYEKDNMAMKSIFVVVALFAYIVSASDVLDLTESTFDTEGGLSSKVRALDLDIDFVLRLNYLSARCLVSDFWK